jgi:hypothetical protein
MKRSTPLQKKDKVEHRGYDVNATKNFNLEMKMVKEYNRPEHILTTGKAGKKHLK